MGNDNDTTVEALKSELLSRIKAEFPWADCEQIAVSLAKAMLESGTEEGLITEELCAMGISKDGAKQLIQLAKPIMPDTPNDTTQTDSDVGNPLCPYCLAPISRFDHSCPKCSGPITSYASIDPTSQVYGYGGMEKKGVSSRPKLGVVLVLWVIFGSQILWLLFEMIRMVINFMSPTYGGVSMLHASDNVVLFIFKLVMLLVFLALYSAILWNVTSRYCEPLDTDEPTDTDEEA